MHASVHVPDAARGLRSRIGAVLVALALLATLVPAIGFVLARPAEAAFSTTMVFSNGDDHVTVGPNAASTSTAPSTTTTSVAARASSTTSCIPPPTSTRADRRLRRAARGRRGQRAQRVAPVDEALHARAMAAYLAGLSRRVSFVDRVSFQLIRDTGLDRAFAFDRDFATEGITLVP